MIYDKELCRGIRSKYLPEPNPTRIEISRDSQLLEIAKSQYFMDFEPEPNDLDLAGMPITVANPESWTLGYFYSLAAKPLQAL